MAEHDEEPAEVQDVCFLTLTRPAMFLGVPMEAFAVVCMVTTVFYVAMGNILWAGFGVVFHFMARAIVWHDYNKFSVLFAWANTGGIQLNKDYWGGASVSPARLYTTYSREDVTHV
jgi:type IV secretion system protein VirB3